VTTGDDDLPPESLGPASANVLRPTFGVRFDPEPRRESVRGIVALGSVVLFALVVLIVLCSVCFGHQQWTHLQGVTAAILPAVTSVTGSTVGFYFGTRDKDDHR
jgi:hypothetical protein